MNKVAQPMTPDMIAHASRAEDLGLNLTAVALAQAEWSQRTFGLDQELGPLAPLRHLAKEVQEAIDAPEDLTEYADCLLLIMDASRRSGFTIYQLVAEALSKQAINVKRTWCASGEGFHEHVRSTPNLES